MAESEEWSHRVKYDAQKRARTVRLLVSYEVASESFNAAILILDYDHRDKGDYIFTMSRKDHKGSLIMLE